MVVNVLCFDLYLQIVSLLLESGVDINLRNFRGQVRLFLLLLFSFIFWIAFLLVRKPYRVTLLESLSECQVLNFLAFYFHLCHHSYSVFIPNQNVVCYI